MKCSAISAQKLLKYKIATFASGLSFVCDNDSSTSQYSVWWRMICKDGKYQQISNSVTSAIKWNVTETGEYRSSKLGQDVDPTADTKVQHSVLNIGRTQKIWDISKLQYLSTSSSYWLIKAAKCRTHQVTFHEHPNTIDGPRALAGFNAPPVQFQTLTPISSKVQVVCSFFLLSFAIHPS